jgi:hypothetical protein
MARIASAAAAACSTAVASSKVRCSIALGSVMTVILSWLWS